MHAGLCTGEHTGGGRVWRRVRGLLDGIRWPRLDSALARSVLKTTRDTDVSVLSPVKAPGVLGAPVLLVTFGAVANDDNLVIGIGVTVSVKHAAGVMHELGRGSCADGHHHRLLCDGGMQLP